MNSLKGNINMANETLDQIKSKADLAANDTVVDLIK